MNKDDIKKLAFLDAAPLEEEHVGPSGQGRPPREEGVEGRARGVHVDAGPGPRRPRAGVQLGRAEARGASARDRPVERASEAEVGLGCSCGASSKGGVMRTLTPLRWGLILALTTSASAVASPSRKPTVMVMSQAPPISEFRFAS